MIFNDWEKFYKKILKDFNFDYNKDIEAAKLLDNFISNSNKDILIKDIKKTLNKKEVYVFGSGPSLLNSIDLFKNDFKKKIIISADGATSALVENKIIPNIIVTDLDGKIKDQIYANKKGSLVLIHAHGDNIQKICEYTDLFNDDIIGTTQTNPDLYKKLYNFGGFTDGDRSVFLADHFKARKINLIGFDYEGLIGEYSFSKNKDKNVKLKKLKWCEFLVNELKKNNRNIKYL